LSFQAQEQLEEAKLEAVQDNNVELVTEILGDISDLKVRDDSAAELSRILQEPHFQVRRSKHGQERVRWMGFKGQLYLSHNQTNVEGGMVSL